MFFGALARRHGCDASTRSGPLVVTPLRRRDRRSALGSLVVVGLFWLGGRYRLRAAGAAAGARRPGAPARAAGARRPSGWLRPGWLLGIPVVWIAALPRRPAGRRLRHLVHPVGDDRGPPDRCRAGRPGHTGQTLLDLTGQMYDYHNDLTRGPPGVVAVVGLAARPQAGLVLPGGPRRRHVRGDLRRRQPRHLVARRSRRWRSSRGRRSSGAACPDPHRDRLRCAVAPVGAHRPGRVPVPLLHGAAVRVHGPRLLPGRAVARGVAADVAPGQGRGRARDHRPGAAVAPRPAAVRVRRRRSGQPGPQACPAIIPDVRPDRPDARRWPSSSGSACCCHRPRFLGGRPRTLLDDGQDGRGALRASPSWPSSLVVAAARSWSSLACPTRDPDPDQHPGRADRAARRASRWLPRAPGPRDARRAPVRGRARGRDRRLVRRPLPELLGLPLPSAVVDAYQGLLPTYL